MNQLVIVRLALASIACMMLALSSSCMIGPTDQTVVSSTGQSIYFSGYYTSPNTGMDVKCTKPSGGTTTFATTTSQSSVANNLFGFDMFVWSAGGHTIPSSCWESGSQGAIARVGAISSAGYPVYSMMPDFLNCYGDHSGNYFDFLTHCSAMSNAGLARVCTSNYVPHGRGRSDCTRSLEFGLSNGKTEKVFLKKGSKTYFATDGALQAPFIEWLSFRGDRRTVVELFETQLYDQDKHTITMFDGSPGPIDALLFNAIRVQYPHSRTSAWPYPVSVPLAMSQLGLVQGTPTDCCPPNSIASGIGSAAVYDMGECSLGKTWAEISAAAEAAVRPVLENDVPPLNDKIESMTLERFFLRPVLSSSGPDRIYVYVQGRFHATAGCCNSARVALHLMLKPVTSTTQVFDMAVEDWRVSVFDKDGVLIRLLDGWKYDLQQTIHDLVAEHMPDMLGTHLTDALLADLPPGSEFVRARRIVETAQGLDVVLADSTTDSQYSLLNTFGLCDSQPVRPTLSNPYWYRIPYDSGP